MHLAIHSGQFRSDLVRTLITVYIHLMWWMTSGGTSDKDSGMDARASLMELLEGLHDPRCAKGKRQPLPALLSLAVVGML